MDVDFNAQVVYVIPAVGAKRSLFRGGKGDLHPRVVAEMYNVLKSSEAYSYIDQVASTLLEEARSAFRNAGLAADSIIALGDTKNALMTWTGTRIQDTLRALLSAHGVQAEDRVVGLVLAVPKAECRQLLQEVTRPPTR